MKSVFYKGEIREINESVNSLLEKGVEIISTSLSKGYPSYGNNNPFVMIVIYKELDS